MFYVEYEAHLFAAMVGLSLRSAGGESCAQLHDGIARKRKSRNCGTTLAVYRRTLTVEELTP